MSLAPASSRGAFLNARLAVNGIQCAARSLGTLTAAGRGLLSSMRGLFIRECDRYGASYQLHRGTGTLRRAIFRLIGPLHEGLRFTAFINRGRRSRTLRLRNLPYPATASAFSGIQLRAPPGIARSRTRGRRVR